MTRTGRAAALLVLAALTAGCGSRLSDARLERAQEVRPAATTRSAVEGNGAPAPAPASAAAPAGPGVTDTGSAAVTGSPSEGPIVNPGTGRAPGSSSAGGPAASGQPSPRAGQDAAAPAAPRPSPGGTPVSTAPAAPAATGGGEIRLGSVGVASGLIGAAMAPIAETARVWAADVNARGGIGGRPVRLIQVDDGGDPSRSLAIVRRLVEQERVQAFYANFMVTTEQAIVGYLNERKVPLIGGCSCTSAVDDSPMLFPIGPGAPLGEAWAHALPFLSLTDKRKASILYCREAENCTVLSKVIKSFADRAGFDVLHDAQISIAQPDFTAEMLAARNAGADVVIVIADNATAARVARSAHRQDYRPTFSIQQAGFDDGLLAQGEDVEGMVTAGIVPDHNTSPKLADYRAAMARHLPNARKATIGAGAWTAGKLIELLAPALPPTPTSADFVAALHGLRGETIGGLQPPLTYEAGKGHALTNLCVIPVVVRSGKFVAPNGEQFSYAPGWKPVGT
jgi:branched-chain amino acid transport system substrate-binding protein